MKKIVISLALVLILCFSLFLISCGDTHTGCTHEYDNTNCDTKCNLCGKPYHNGHELVTPSIEGCQVPSYCTRCDYQTCEELIIEHLFVDENGDALEKCARCNALNPDALEDEIPTKTVAELRNEKVLFDLDYHEIGDMLEKEETEADSTKHQFGYLGTNESGNKYIIYAPNIYSYYVSIKCTDDFSGVESVIRKIEYDYFDRSHIGGNDETHIDTVELFDNEILITFPDFDSYALCQEELLNKLSALDSVLKINVSYINAQDGTKQVNNPYEYINLGYYWKLEEQNRIFRTYEEFSQAFADISTDALDEITAQTFESYYVFMVICTYSGDTHGFDISDAKVDGNRVFFTTNKYVKSGLHDMWLATDYCIVLVPKEELGELPNEISSVIDMQIAVYVDRYEPTTIDMGDAISIAFSHFYANCISTPETDYTYIAEAIDGDCFDDYWYIWIHPVYIGNEGDGPLWDGEDFIYTIDKSNGGIIKITSE